MIGQFVTSKAGHDKGCLYVVVGQEDDFVYLSDGRLKGPDRPKKKRRKHIQPINARVEESLLERLRAGEKVYPEEIKYALKQYLS
nr:KOW domain-containing RNA-binding protein [uncultured Acetatifactor sp.]